MVADAGPAIRLNGRIDESDARPEAARPTISRLASTSRPPFINSSTLTRMPTAMRAATAFVTACSTASGKRRPLSRPPPYSPDLTLQAGESVEQVTVTEMYLEAVKRHLDGGEGSQHVSIDDLLHLPVGHGVWYFAARRPTAGPRMVPEGGRNKPIGEVVTVSPRYGVNLTNARAPPSVDRVRRSQTGLGGPLRRHRPSPRSVQEPSGAPAEARR